MKKLVSLVLALMMVLAAVPALAVTAYPDTYYDEQVQLAVDNMVKWYEEKYGEGSLLTKYDEPVTVNMVNYYSTALETNMATWNAQWGETLEYNRYVEVLERVFNIKVNYLWLKNSADNGYVQQLRLAIAANELPDIFLVTDQTDMLQLAEAELIMPVDDIIDKNFTTLCKETMSSDGGMLLEMAKYDGKTYGIPRNISDTDTFSYLWLREDWMEEQKLERPKTMEDLKNIMVTFQKAYGGYGMMIDKGLWYGQRGLFAGFNAHPEFWIPDGNGNLVWGGTTEENKAALKYLNELYKEGLLDPEFITQSNGDAQALFLNEQTGVLYAGHWVAHQLQKAWEKNDKVDWYCVELPSVDGQPVDQYLNPVRRGWVVIREGYEHPEIAAKISAANAFYVNSGIVNGTWFFSNDNAQELGPIQGAVSSWDNYNTWLNLLECYEKNDPSVLRAKAITYWSNLHTGDANQWAWDHMFSDQPDLPMSVLANAINDGRINYDGFLGAPSELMNDRWSTIKSEQLVAFTKMIIGEVDVDAGFEAWLKTFDAMGGTQITAEVNEWYATSSFK